MNKTKTICRLPNGKFVEEYAYSQGYFECIETVDPWVAMDFVGKECQFNTFFRHHGGELVEIEIIIRGLEVDVYG